MIDMVFQIIIIKINELNIHENNLLLDDPVYRLGLFLFLQFLFFTGQRQR